MSSLLGEADLLPLQGGVPEGGADDELAAVPLAGLAELDVERLSGRGARTYRTEVSGTTWPGIAWPSWR